jgi:hypothetical protein
VKINKLFGSIVIVVLIGLMSITSVLADAPAPPVGFENIEPLWYTGFGSGGSTEQCFDLPNGWVDKVIRFWHPADQKWVDLATTYQTVDGVKQACTIVPANGWVALQGKYIQELVDPEKTFCDRNPDDDVCQPVVLCSL